MLLVRDHPARAAAVAVMCILLGASRPALAQDAPPTAPDALVDRALDLREAGDDMQARALIRQAYDADPSPRTAAQLGLVEQALGLWVEAERHLADAVSRAEDPWIRRHRRALEQSLEVVRGSLGSLEIVGNVPGATISVDGTAVGTLPLAAPLRLPVGRVEIEVTAEGYRSQTFTVQVAARGLARQLVELRALPPPSPSMAAQLTPAASDTSLPAASAGSDRSAPTPASPAASAAGPTFLWSWALLVGTAVVGGTTAAVGGYTQSVFDRLSRSCGGVGCTDAEIAGSGLGTAQTATNALLVATGVLGAATLVSFIVEGTSSGSGASVAVGPGGLVVRGQF